MPGRRRRPLAFPDGAFDLVLSAFTFDNIPTAAKKTALLRDLARLAGDDGCVVNLVSAPDIYLHEWASFSTKDFPENRRARCGDRVRIIITAVEDPRPVEDILWTDAGYRRVYRAAGLKAVETHKPLATGSEPFGWVSETCIAPWTIYVLKRAVRAAPA